MAQRSHAAERARLVEFTGSAIQYQVTSEAGFQRRSSSSSFLLSQSAMTISKKTKMVIKK